MLSVNIHQYNNYLDTGPFHWHFWPHVLKHATQICFSKTSLNVPAWAKPRQVLHCPEWGQRMPGPPLSMLQCCASRRNLGCGLLRTFYYWTQCWRWSPVHSYESCSVVFWSQNNLIFRLWKYLDRQLSQPTAPITWKGILFNQAALLDFPKVIGPNGSNSVSENTHFAGTVTIK